MKKTIDNIDAALKTIYRLDNTENAREFILPIRPKNASRQGALFIEDNSQKDEVNVGIYLNPDIQQSLEALEAVPPHQWTAEHLNAFAVAAEEVSHFHFLLFRVKSGTQVSQVELETQGDVDRFFLTFFASTENPDQKKSVFSELFEKFFLNHQYSNLLTEEEKSRYVDANTIAKSFVRSTEPVITAKDSTQALESLRKFYRLPSYEKLRFR